MCVDNNKNESAAEGVKHDKKEMRTADCVPVGMAFVGSIWRDDFSEAMAGLTGSQIGKRFRDFPGELIRVAMVLPATTDDGAKEIMHMMRALPHDSTSQLSSDLSMWICGIREKRSNKVRLIEWGQRDAAPQS